MYVSCQIGSGINAANIIAVQEGLFLYTRNVSPYDGGVFHQVSGLHYLDLDHSIDTGLIGTPPITALRPTPRCEELASPHGLLLFPG